MFIEHETNDKGESSGFECAHKKFRRDANQIVRLSLAETVLKQSACL